MPPLPAEARRSLLVYNLLFPLVLVALLPGLLLRMFCRGGFRENFGQRLGRYSPETRAHFAKGRWWWLHSISVGETGVALKLAHELHRRDPALQLVISVTTSTGFALAEKSAADWLAVIYNPLDAPSIVRSALDLIRPERLILIEGEAWPNLLAACHAASIPTALVEARLSPRSERRMLTARFWIAPIFNLLDQILLPTLADLRRWQNLGILASRLAVTGSIKFDTAGDPSLRRQSEFRQLLSAHGIPATAPLLVAGSTWAPEERILAELLRALRTEFSDLVLILVPRHIERTPQVLTDLSSLGLRIIRRSETPPSTQTAPPDILLVDTTGELREWYGLATVVFVGKSLPGIKQIGGQNPVEPAALGKATVTGPHMENFRAVMELLNREQAIRTVHNPADLQETIAFLLRDEPIRSALAKRATYALTQHRDATARTAERLLFAG